jgi:hypothetical protein
MIWDRDGNLKVQCLLKEYEEATESFRHTYETIWQSSILFATFSIAVFGFFFSFHNDLKIYAPYLPFVSLSSILLWWLMIFEPMNHYGDVRQKRCQEIEDELSKAVPYLKMSLFNDYSKSKGKYLRVRYGTRILALITIVLMLLLALTLVFPSVTLKFS